MKQWEEKKKLYGYLKQQTDEIWHENICAWLRKEKLKREPESLIATQNNVIISYLPTPPLGQDMTRGQFFFYQSLTGLNSEFSFS